MGKHFPPHSSLGFLGDGVQYLPALVGAGVHLSGAPDNGAGLGKSPSSSLQCCRGTGPSVADSSPESKDVWDTGQKSLPGGARPSPPALSGA